MKNSPLAAFLVAVLAVSALLSIVFCGLYISSSREKHRWEVQVEGIKNRNKAVTRLANEVLEYSKHDTNVDAILVWANLKPKSNSATSNKGDEPVNVTAPAQLTPTNTTCAQFASGTAQIQGNITYQVKSNKISNEQPGVFLLLGDK